MDGGWQHFLKMKQACKDAFIIVDQEKRRDIIKAQIEEIAKAHNGHAEITEDLLE